MSIDLDSMFQYKKPNSEKLLSHGFIKSHNAFARGFSIMEGQFQAVVTIPPEEKIRFQVIDNATGEEYVLVHVENAHGSFVSAVRKACEEVLREVSSQCFDTDVYKAEQTKRVLAFLQSAYGIAPEFLWKKSPDSAALRRQDNKKWFAVIMTVDKTKLGLSDSGLTEIIDMKAAPSTVQALLKKQGFHPAFHMNKKHWFTVCLDGSISDETLFGLLTQSFWCTGFGTPSPID